MIVKTRLLVLFVFVAAACLAQPLTPRQEEQWRTEIRSALRLPDRLPELGPEVHGRFTPAPGVVAERVTYIEIPQVAET